jgi:hypothetical protein
MKQTLIVDQKGFSGVLYPYSSDKTNAQKSDISTKIYVYSYRRPTDKLLVVQKYFVGVVGQSNATHSPQSTKNILGTRE